MQNANKIIAAYTEAFSKRYPNVKLDIQRATGKNKGRYHVVMNGDPGDITLSLGDMQEATASLLR